MAAPEVHGEGLWLFPHIGQAIHDVSLSWQVGYAKPLHKAVGVS